MKAILAIDSFKGCLSSPEAEEAASSAFPSHEDTVMIPVSDGGEGFSAIMTALLGGSTRTVLCQDPLGRPVEASYGLAHGGRTAIIETAAASGLCLLREEERNPLAASTFGTGQLIADALDEGAEEIWLGLGGSATCDGGTGLLQALGYRFMTPGGILPDGRTVMGNIIGIDSTHRHKQLSHCKITGFYDVSVPFYGAGGTARVFAPQKGAGAAMVEALDAWMSQLCEVYSEFSGRDIRTVPGSGAAGGTGGAIRSCMGASMTPGAFQLLDEAGMGPLLDTCTLVITGEGHADLQTLRGKVPAGVLEYVRKYDSECGGSRHTQVALVAGQVSDRDALLRAGFDYVVEATPEGMPISLAMDPATARENIKKAVGIIAHGPDR